MTRASLTAVTANIGRGVPADQVARNIDRVFAAYRQNRYRAFGLSIGWQEVDDDDAPGDNERRRLRLNVDRFGGELVGMETTCPIYVAPGWHVVRYRVDVTCPGRAGLTPHRVAVQALIEHDATGARVAHVNGQYPREFIRDLWLECDASWRDVVVPRWLEQGLSVLATRDRNRPARNSPKLAAHEQQLLGDGTSIDQVSFIRSTGPKAARLLRRGPVRLVDLDIDGHNAHGRPLTFYVPS